MMKTIKIIREAWTGSGWDFVKDLFGTVCLFGLLFLFLFILEILK